MNEDWTNDEPRTVKVGDLVVRSDRIYPMGQGIVLDTYKNPDSTFFYEVQWFTDARMWYDEPELKVISESR